ncbi:hypothetical protein BH11BAC2_BH11BAC2_22070 [soil metagenome]
MKKILKYIFSVSTILIIPATVVLAGNEDRAGQAGASELLINPWARSSGWGGANSAMVQGIEAMNINVAGLSYVKGTEILFCNTQWLKGSDVKINSFGLAQKVGESGAMGLSIMSVGFGDIERTTETQPDGGSGTFSPQFLNIGLSYSKEFSNSIHGGMTLRLISESISDVKSQGVAVDAGIQYVTGFNEAKDNLKFGIALRNVGTPMKFSGEGLAFRNDNQTTNINVLQEQRTQDYELPSLVSIGLSYDFKLAVDHRLTAAGNFTSNSFIRDQFAVGVEYGFKNMFMIRGGYTFDKKDKNAITDQRISAMLGASAGITLQVPLGKSGKMFGIDYSYRATETFDGTHSFGVRLTL